MVEKKYTSLLCCSKSTKDFILKEGIEEFKDRYPLYNNQKVTHDMVLVDMVRRYTLKNLPRENK